MSYLARELCTAYGFAAHSLGPTGRLDRNRVLSIQRRKLHRLLQHAYERVPYYRRAFDHAGVRPEDIRDPADLRALPLTSKDSLRAVPVRETIAQGLVPGRLLTSTTSGVTAAPFTIRRTRSERLLASLYGLRAFRYYGLRPTDRRAEVHHIRRGRGPEASYRRRALLYRQICVECTLPTGHILEILARYAPQLVSGHPTVLSQVADLVVERDRAVHWRPRFVTCYSEVLSPGARARMVRAFAAPVYNMYGSRELDLVAWECKETGDLHVCDDNVVLEILRDGEPVAPGEEGEVVATNLGAFAMPFIRYRIGDTAVRGHDICPCGAPYSTVRGILGRVIECFPMPDGSLLHPYVLIGAMIDTCDWVRRYQLVQETLERIVLYMVPGGRPSSAEIGRLEMEGRQRLGSGVHFRVELVDALDAGPGGKFRPAVSRVARASGRGPDTERAASSVCTDGRAFASPAYGSANLPRPSDGDDLTYRRRDGFSGT